jgi:hypothetical protein
MGVLAATDPYPTGLAGYDVSYPQCGGTAATGSFGIVGVNGGRPFTNNSCLGAEYAAAPKSTAPSLYINTGYAGAYRNNITAGCSALSGSVSGTSRQVQAWATGGNFTPSSVAADWEAAGGSCSAPFTSSPVWLVQSTTSGFDSDLAC